jgi:uncharacterized DUF497 family protein
MSAASVPPSFEWDEAKNERNSGKHGMDFRDAVKVCQKPPLGRIDDRRAYGETRVNSIGEMDQRIIVNVTHTDREGRIRLISARLATVAERDLYRASSVD